MSARFIDIDTAHRQLPDSDRILVIGCSGGGKSTLSRRLSDRFALPYISMDRDIFWLTGWVERERGEQRRILADIVAQPRWLMDGTNSSSFDLRLPRADLVIWVRMPRWLCLRGVTLRWLKHFGRTRPEMAPGCPERLEWQFLRFIWTFEHVHVPKILAGLDRYGADLPVVVLKSRADMARLLDLAGPPA